MSFYELGLDAPLEAVTTIHDPLTCERECCRGMRIRSVTTPAGTRVRPPPLSCVPLKADPELLEAVEELDRPDTPPIESYESSPDTDDLYDATTGDVDYDYEAQRQAEYMAQKEAERANIRALQLREEATRLCVLGVHATGTTRNDSVLQCVIKCYTATGEGVMGYDRLWTIPEKTKITLKAFKFHKVHYRDLRASGAPPAQELTTILGVLGRLVARGVRIIVHNAKPTLRLLEQTAAQNGRKGWKFPFLCTDLSIKSKRILNMPAKINPTVLATPSERDVYAYLYKKQYDDEDDDITSITDLATTCKIVVLNYLAGIGRGWWE
tara:strand:+ start:146 stop:1117 length:972 start_codon:yes stop_codon:yes gene_type:complete